MNNFILTLTQEFELHGNPVIAQQQKAYMRNQYEFYGLKSLQRRTIQQPFLVKAYLPPKKDIPELVKSLWKKSQRDYHYFAQELAFKYVKQLDVKDIGLYEYMVSHNSWWDTVDYIAVKLMGNYFKKFPDKRKKYVDKWLDSNNIWLQRSALLFQLKYKSEIDTEILSYGIKNLLGSKEFFINKAIGWVLREYSRTNPSWVSNFVAQNNLSPLSKKEALRLMIN